LSYFWGHNGTSVPIGTVLPFEAVTSDGGIIWDRWVSIYTNATLFDYATAGAVCSNEIVKKYIPGVVAPIPDVLGSEIPSFIDDTHYVNPSTGTNTVYENNRKADNTVYALWIGRRWTSFSGPFSNSLNHKVPMIWARTPFSPTVHSRGPQ
jgi:hypothetical protein